MEAKDQSEETLQLPRLPVRANIYIASDGTVHFGALFADLVPVAAAVAGAAAVAARLSTPADDSSGALTDPPSEEAKVATDAAPGEGSRA